MDLIIPNQLNGKTPQQKNHAAFHLQNTCTQSTTQGPCGGPLVRFHHLSRALPLGLVFIFTEVCVCAWSEGEGNSIIKPARNISSSRDATDHLGVYDFHTALATPLQLVSSLKISITFIWCPLLGCTFSSSPLKLPLLTLFFLRELVTQHLLQLPPFLFPPPKWPPQTIYTN